MTIDYKMKVSKDTKTTVKKNGINRLHDLVSKQIDFKISHTNLSRDMLKIDEILYTIKECVRDGYDSYYKL